MIAVRQGMVVVVLEKSTEITYSFTTATATATTETITAPATIATITPTATTIANKKSKGTTLPPLPSQENVIVIFLIRNYIPSLISPFAITTTSLRVVVGQLFCAGIFRLRYDILLLLCVYCDHNLLIPKFSLKNIELCVFYDH